MRKISKAIIILMIIIIILIVIILNLPKNNIVDNDYDERYDYPESNEQDYVLNNVLTKVQDADVYFSTKNILNDYIKYFESINGDTTIDIGRAQVSETEIKKQIANSALLAITEIFDEQYKKEKQLDEQKIKSYVQKFKKTQSQSSYYLDIKEMYTASIDEDNSLMLVYSKLNGVQFDCMVKVNYTNNVYSIFWEDYLKDKNYTKDRKEKISIDSTIKKGEYNTFFAIYPNKEYIVMQYFDNLKYRMKNSSKELYEILDEEYKQKRFSSEEIFSNYIQDIYNRIDKLSVSKYKYNDNEIKILDNFDNVYTFKVSGIMEYKIMLDNYTVEDAEIGSSYDKSSEQEKVYSNISKFINMINNKDYNNAYDKLDNTFKNNNYKTLNEFKAFINSNFYDYNIIDNADSMVKNGNYYICTLNLKNGENQNIESRKITIIMQLKENRDFVMSFNLE